MPFGEPKFEKVNPIFQELADAFSMEIRELPDVIDKENWEKLIEKIGNAADKSEQRLKEKSQDTMYRAPFYRIHGGGPAREVERAERLGHIHEKLAHLYNELPINKYIS